MKVSLALSGSLSVAVAVAPSYAADLSPGLWEISMEMRVPGQPEFQPPPFLLKQCLTAADARDPSKVLGQAANPGATGCSYSDRSYSGNTFRFSVQCAGTFAIRQRGEMTFGSNSMNGTLTGTADVGGQKTEINNKIAARRLGNC